MVPGLPGPRGTAVASSDCVLVLGSAFNGNLVYGGPPLFNEDQTLIQVDVAADQMGGNRRSDIAVQGDVREVVTQMAQSRLRSRSGRAWLEQGRELVDISRQMWDQQVDDHHGPLVHPGALCREVASFARESWAGASTLVADGGDTLTWALAYGEADGPGRMLSTTTALGTLGVGLPFALAAKVARPEEPVVLISGDGAFGLSAMEMDTAARHHLPVIVVVANNGGWGDVATTSGRCTAARSPAPSPTLATTCSRSPSAATASGSRASPISVPRWRAPRPPARRR